MLQPWRVAYLRQQADVHQALHARAAEVLDRLFQLQTRTGGPLIQRRVRRAHDLDDQLRARRQQSRELAGFDRAVRQYTSQPFSLLGPRRQSLSAGGHLGQQCQLEVGND